MTAVPIPQPPSQSGRSPNPAKPPVAELQELVASLTRDRHKIQNLLSSLGFALRSFNNLHQFLEIVPLMAARVADADASALILFEPDGRVQLEQLHCQTGRTCQNIRQAILTAARTIRPQAASGLASPLGAAVAAEPGGNPSNIFWLADATRQTFEQEILHGLEPQTRLYGVPILVKSVERGRLYVLSYACDYVWTPMREQLAQLVADQAAVAIANNDLTAELRQKERLDRELEIAADIQLHLLPQACPQRDRQSDSQRQFLLQ
ncbi:MAG: GAF domain-containing protein [Cyanobacteria bacterium J06641_5]